jgi:hypothetical protein
VRKTDRWLFFFQVCETVQRKFNVTSDRANCKVVNMKVCFDGTRFASGKNSFYFRGAKL